MKAGTIITCPNDACGAEQLKTTKDVPSGGRLSEAGFESLGFNLETAMNTNCYKCGATWYRKHPKTGRGQIHTKDNLWTQLGGSKHEKIIIHPSTKLIH